MAGTLGRRGKVDPTLKNARSGASRGGIVTRNNKIQLPLLCALKISLVENLLKVYISSSWQFFIQCLLSKGHELQCPRWMITRAAILVVRGSDVGDEKETLNITRCFIDDSSVSVAHLLLMYHLNCTVPPFSLFSS